MSAHWHVGMKVVCVDAFGAHHLVNGSIYTITDIDTEGGYSATHGYAAIGVSVKEAAPNHDDQFFHPGRFRPVQTKKTSIEIFNRILLNPSIKIREDA